MKRTALVALLALTIAAPLSAHRPSRGRWIVIKTIVDLRSQWQGAEIFYGTFRDAKDADAFCRKLIAAPGPVCRCKPEQLVRPAEVKVRP